MTTEESDRLTKTTSVPNWMLQVAVWVFGMLGTGAVLTLVSTVNWCFWMQHKQGEMQAEQAVIKGSLERIEKDVAVIKARMP